MTSILLIDDDPLITEPTSHALETAGYTVLVAHDGEAGLRLTFEQNPDVVVLDIMMPGMDGWEVCKRIRDSSPVPILMLTALNEEVDRILGLELGADDYLAKPFSVRELIARIRSLIRRVILDQEQQPESNQLECESIKVDIDRRTAFKDEQAITLRYKEFELLSLLMSKAGIVVSRAELLDQVWGTDWLGDTRTLDVHIRWLREKVEDDPSNPHYIQTIRGVGYRFHD